MLTGASGKMGLKPKLPLGKKEISTTKRGGMLCCRK